MFMLYLYSFRSQFSVVGGILFTESLPKYHEDHIAGRGNNSQQHYHLVHKYIPMPQAMKIPAAKAAVDKEWENWRKFRRGT